MSTSSFNERSEILSCTEVDPHGVAAPFREEVRRDLELFDFTPRLVGFLATDHAPSRVYARVTERTLGADGIEFRLREVGRHQLEGALRAANQDSDIHGIIVYYPVFGDGQDSYLREVVSPEKDVEGLGARYRYNLYHNIRFLDSGQVRKSLIPCTPLAVVKVLEHYQVYRPGAELGEQLSGLTACVINRSEVVGRPLAAMLAHDGAVVFSIDINGVLVYRDSRVEETEVGVEEAIGRADILVTAVPAADYGPIGPGDVKPGVVAVDLSGLGNISDDITQVASLYCPNVGPITVAMVERNLVRLLKNFRLG